jgi:hypothetical protein
MAARGANLGSEYDLLAAVWARFRGGWKPFTGLSRSLLSAASMASISPFFRLTQSITMHLLVIAFLCLTVPLSCFSVTLIVIELVIFIVLAASFFTSLFSPFLATHNAGHVHFPSYISLIVLHPSQHYSVLESAIFFP